MMESKRNELYSRIKPASERQVRIEIKQNNAIKYVENVTNNKNVYIVITG